MGGAKKSFGRGGWTPERLPDLAGKVAVITGANSGIGFEAAGVMAARGAKQIWLCRNAEKANAARDQVLSASPDAAIEVIAMDLSNLDTVRTAAAEVRNRVDGIDALINNAGIMMLPTRELTDQGLEKQIGVNHFGHFALHGLLADLVDARAGRFVSVSSLVHKSGAIHRDDLMLETGYAAVKSYAQSKLANLMYIRDLDLRLRGAGKESIAIGCHPGYSATNLQTTGPGAIWGAIMSMSNAILAQKAERGAWPTLLAAFDTEAERGGYYGPTGIGETRGAVDAASVASQADDRDMAQWLWAQSVERTGVDWSSIGLD